MANNCQKFFTLFSYNFACNFFNNWAFFFIIFGFFITKNLTSCCAPIWLAKLNIGGKDWFDISANALSFLVVVSIPIVLELYRKSDSKQSEISRLANIISDRLFYVEVTAVSWEIASKWISWKGIYGDIYRVQVVGGMIIFRQFPFNNEHEAQFVPFQNRIRFQGHHEPLSGFLNSEKGADINRPNEHMILTIWLNYWKEVERDIYYKRISEKDAYERLSFIYSWFHDFHQQLWMVEFILKSSDFNSPNSLESLREIASLEARFRRRAKRARARVAFSVTDKNWEKAYKIASNLFEQKQDIA